MKLSARFSPEHLLCGLMTNLHIGKHVFCYDSVSSTNDIAHQLAKSGAQSGTIIIAEFQTAGRGRSAKKWIAQKGENITTSVILRPTVPLEELTALPLLVALSVAQAIEDIAGMQVEIKWPNDVLMQHKKVAGVLVETSAQAGTVDYVVVGIGLNVNQAQFPEDLAKQATSLFLETGIMHDKSTLLVSLMRFLDANYMRLVKGETESMLKTWRTYCKMLGKHITFYQGNLRRQGLALDIDKRGFLRVEINQREELLSQAEIQTVRY